LQKSLVSFNLHHTINGSQDLKTEFNKLFDYFLFMVQAVGIDIVDMGRFQKAVEKWGQRFTHRILTEKEIKYCRRKATGVQSMAVRFAAKEALIKCLPPQEKIAFPWHDAEILSGKGGKPAISLHGRVAQLLRDKQVLVSLSHSENSAVAVIILQ